jgi:hypothetical protein
MMDGETAAPVPPVEGDRDRRLLRPASACPRCGSRPALRLSEAAVRLAAGRRPDERLGTYQCQRRGCGAIYDLTAGGFQKAT